MSESLRDLVVSLSLNSDNFTRNIRSVTAQIKEAESSFALAGAGVAKFESTSAGLGSKLSMLQTKMERQGQIVVQYEKALEAANDKLQKSVGYHDKTKTSLDQARQTYATLGQQVQSASDQYKRYADTLGETDSATIAAKQNLDTFKEEHAAALRVRRSSDWKVPWSPRAKLCRPQRTAFSRPTPTSTTPRPLTGKPLPRSTRYRQQASSCPLCWHKPHFRKGVAACLRYDWLVHAF